MGVSASSLCFPAKVALDGLANLYISTFSDNRVLEYNEGTNPSANLTANRVFGQTTFTASGCNLGANTPTAATLCEPSGLATDLAGDLFILDADNNRVLKYITPLTASATEGSGYTTADVVLGQPNFVHGQVNLVDESSLDLPRQIAVGLSNHLYVADASNNRVLGWRNASGFSNGAPADLVIGQADFLSAGINRTGASTPTASTLWLPYGVAVDRGRRPLRRRRPQQSDFGILVRHSRPAPAYSRASGAPPTKYSDRPASPPEPATMAARRLLPRRCAIRNRLPSTTWAISMSRTSATTGRSNTTRRSPRRVSKEAAIRPPTWCSDRD